MELNIKQNIKTWNLSLTKHQKMEPKFNKTSKHGTKTKHKHKQNIKTLN